MPLPVSSRYATGTRLICRQSGNECLTYPPSYPPYRDSKARILRKTGTAPGRIVPIKPAGGSDRPEVRSRSLQPDQARLAEVVHGASRASDDSRRRPRPSATRTARSVAGGITRKPWQQKKAAVRSWQRSASGHRRRADRSGTNKLFVRRNARGTSFAQVVDIRRPWRSIGGSTPSKSAEAWPRRPRG